MCSRSHTAGDFAGVLLLVTNALLLLLQQQQQTYTRGPVLLLAVDD
jgi:hypothetical protein